jgi:formate hydrogenlyase transcriptional activator
MLVHQFVREAAADLGKQPPVVPDRIYRSLAHYDFPGNIRELRAMVFDAVARHTAGTLPIDPFLEAMGPLGAADNETVRADVSQGDVISEPAWREMERTNLLNALRRANWKISGRGGAAEMLSIKPSTLESRMKAFAIDKPS